MHSEACIGQKKSVYEGTNAVPRQGTFDFFGEALILCIVDLDCRHSLFVSFASSETRNQRVRPNAFLILEQP